MEVTGEQTPRSLIRIPLKKINVMYRPQLLVCVYFLLGVVAYGQPVNQQTLGDQSPAVVAENIRITYGVPPHITLEIIKVYEQQGSSPAGRNAAVNALIKKYKALGSKSGSLTKPQQSSLGLSANSPLISILNYDLFMSTRGDQSPAIYAPGGSAEIWYGIPPEAFRSIWDLLEAKQLALEDFDKKFEEQIRKFKELKSELDARADYDKIAARAKAKLEAGDIAGAELILEEDALRANKQTAFRNYEVARVKELNLKPQEADEYYMLAALLDKENPTYTYAYGKYLIEAGQYQKATAQLQLSMDHLSDQNTQHLPAAERFNQLGEAHRGLAEYDQAIAFYEQAQNILLGLDETHLSRLADTYNNLGLAFVAKGEINRGIDYYHRALEIYQEKPESFYPQIAITYNNLGSAYAYKRDFPQALEYYEFSRKVLSDIYGEDHPRVATSLNNIGYTYGNMQEPDKSLEYFQRALEMLSKVYGEDHPNFARTYGNLGVAYAYKGDIDRALEYYTKVLAIDQRIYGEIHPDVADDYTNIGNAWLSKNDYPKAIEYFTKALAIDRQVHGNYHLRIARDHGNLGATYLGRQAYDQAIDAYQQVIENYKYITNGDPNKLLTAYNNIAAAYAQQKEFPKAIEALEQARSVARQFVPEDHPYIQRFDRDIQYLRGRMK